MNSDLYTASRWLPQKIASSGKLLLTMLLCLFVMEAYAQPAVTITNGPTTCGGTNGLIRISNLLISQPYIVFYNKNGTPLPGAFILSTDASGNLDIVTWGTFTMTAGTYTDIQISDGVVNNYFAGPYVLTDPAPPVPAPTSNSPVCAGGTLNLSTTMLGATYAWTGPNSFSSNSMAPSISPVSTASAGTYTLQVVANSTLCTASVDIVVDINPVPVIGAMTNRVSCHGGNSGILDIPENIIGTTFTWTNNDPSIGLAASGTGNIPGFAGVNNTNAPVTATVTITPSFGGCTGAPKTVNYTINPIPVLDQISDKNLCNNAVSSGIPVTSAVSAFASWTNSQTSIGLAASGVGNVPSFTATNTGTTPVTSVVTYSAIANGCTGPNMTFNITVAPTPTISTISNQVYCNGAPVSTLNIPGVVSGSTFTWTNSQPSIGLAASGTGNIPAFTATNNTNAPVTATITIIPTANGCTGPNQTYTITVNPTPTTNTITNQIFCNGVTAPLTTISGPVSGTSFAWTNSQTSIGLAANGTGDISSFTAANTGVTPVNAIIGITPSANGCTGAASSFNITVNPTPALGTITNQAVCHGSPTGFVNIPATVSGTTFAWTNNNTSIGLGASGNGNIGSFTATNTTNIPAIATISITPSANGCTGAVGTFTITANPIPAVNVVSNQTRCNGAATNAVTFTGSVSGASYNWINNNTATGLGANGTGNINSFTATNTTTVPINSVIAVTPVANGCTGSATAFSITVNPTPTVGTMASQTLCNGTLTAPVNIPSPVSGATFTWTNNNTSIGLGSNGSGNIPAFIATNTNVSTEVGTLMIVPTANGCAGPVGMLEYIVHPTPTVDPIPNMPLCNTAPFSAITLSGPVSGSTFAWTNNKTSIGLAANGTASIPAFTATNGTTAPVVAIIGLTATANGCVGTTSSFNIIVNPTPTVDPLVNIAVCNNAVAPAIGFNSPVSGTTYAWVNNDISIGLPATGTGGIDTFTAKNNTVLPVVATITVTPTANNCVGIPNSYTVRVNPTPMLSTLLNPPAVCNKVVFNYDPATASPDSSFTWSRDPVTGIANAKATGKENINEVLDNTTPNPLTVKYIYTIKANSCVNTQTVSVVVNPTPLLTSPGTASVCGSSKLEYKPATLTAGTTYSWSRASVTGITPATGSGTGDISETLTNTLKQPVDVIYIYTLTANGCTNKQQVKVKVNYLPEIAEITTKPPMNVCAGTMYQNFGVAVAPGADRGYAWTADNAVMWAQGEDRQYSVVSFPNPGKATVRLTTSVPSSSCKVDAIYEVNVSSDKADQPDITYFNGRFLSLYKADAYSWGYEDKTTMDSTLAVGETNQDYYVPNADFANRYYWVITVKNGCMQKTYYNKPLDVAAIPVEHKLNIYPNPATDNVTVEFKQQSDKAYQISLHDMTGRMVRNVSATGDKTLLQIAELPAGVYTISCYSEGVRIVSSRFVKN